MKNNATCATCPWWSEAADPTDDPACRKADAVQQFYYGGAGTVEDPALWWCSEHPGRKLPDVHDVAVRLMAGQGYAISEAFDEAERVLAETKRRQGGINP